MRVVSRFWINNKDEFRRLGYLCGADKLSKSVFGGRVRYPIEVFMCEDRIVVFAYGDDGYSRINIFSDSHGKPCLNREIAQEATMRDKRDDLVNRLERNNG